MGDAIGSVLDRLQGLFGKSFLVVGLFPLVTGIVFSLPLIWVVDPEAPFRLQDFLDIPAGGQALYVAAGIFLVIFVAFLLSVMNSWFHSLLEGRAFPIGHRYLAGAQIREYLQLEKRLAELRVVVVDFRISGDQWKDDLNEARQRAPSAAASDLGIADATEQAYDVVSRARLYGGFITPRDLAGLYRQLISEYGSTSADAVPRLREIHDEFDGLVDYARTRAEGELNRITEEKLTRFPSDPGVIESTELANAALANLDRMHKRFGMNIDTVWPLLEKIARADEQMKVGLEEAKLRLDFSVSMTIVAGAFSSVWPPILLWQHANEWVFFLVTLFGPVGSHLFYRMCVRNARGLYATMRAVAELYRFEVLKALHCPLPAHLKQEQKLWGQLAELAELDEGNLTYLHPS